MKGLKFADNVEQWEVAMVSQNIMPVHTPRTQELEESDGLLGVKAKQSGLLSGMHFGLT